jgi:DNA-binding CsgD family transcriptional regulator/predicted ester cyclase
MSNIQDSIAGNKTLERLTNEFVLPLWNEHKFEVIEKFIAKDADIHTTFLVGRGPEAMQQSIVETFNAFPVFELTVQAIIQQGPKVTYKWTAQAEHRGAILNIKPTNKRLEFHGIVYGELDLENHQIIQYHSFSNIPQILYANIEKTTSSELFPSHVVLMDHENYEKEISDLLFSITKLTSVRLSRREAECLNYWLKGYSIKETARQLGGLSVKTIQVFRDNIRKKFNVASYHALFELMQKTGVLALFLGS